MTPHNFNIECWGKSNHMIFKNIFVKSQKITFIFGSPRGGTTYLWSLLESSSDVMPFVEDLNKNSEGKYKTSESGIYIRDEVNACKSIIGFSKKYPSYRIIEKTPSHTLKYKRILKDFPKSENLIIFRHPLAIFNSIIKSEMIAFKDFTVDSAIQLIKDYYFNLIELSKLHNSMVLTYELLLENTNEVLSEIFNHLDLNISNISSIVASNKGKTKIAVAGVFRKGVAFSYNYELDDSVKKKLLESLAYEVSFYETLMF